MKKRTFAILGLGIFGSSIAQELYQRNFEVIAIDTDIVKVDKIASIGVNAYQADFTNVNSLKAIGMDDVDVGIVASGSRLEDSVMAIMNLKELGVPFVMAKARNNKYMEVLLKVGADKVIIPEKEMGQRVARQLTSEKIVDLYEIDKEYNVYGNGNYEEIKINMDGSSKDIKFNYIVARYDSSNLPKELSEFMRLLKQTIYETE